MKLLLLFALAASARPPGHGAPPPFTLDVTAALGGTVKVGHDAPDGSVMVCPGGKVCQTSVPRNAPLLLKWYPDSGAGVNSWSGACRDAGEVCRLAMGAPRSVSAAPATAAVLRLTSTPGGTLHAASPWKSADCRWDSDCSLSYPAGSSVTVTAVPDPMFVARSWNRPCLGVAASAPCSVTVTGTTYVNVLFDDVGANLSATPFEGRIEAWRESDKDAGTMTEANKVLDCAFPPGPKCSARLEKDAALWARRTLPAGATESEWWWSGACVGFQHAAECRFSAAYTRDQVGLQKGKAIVVAPPKGGAVNITVSEYTAQWNQTCRDGGSASDCVVLWTDGVPMQVTVAVDAPQGMKAVWTGAPNCDQFNRCRFDALPATANVGVSFAK